MGRQEGDLSSSARETCIIVKTNDLQRGVNLVKMSKNLSAMDCWVAVVSQDAS